MAQENQVFVKFFGHADKAHIVGECLLSKVYHQEFLFTLGSAVLLTSTQVLFRIVL